MDVCVVCVLCACMYRLLWYCPQNCGLLTLGACARVRVVVLCVCLSVTTLAATYLVYTLKVRCH